MPAVIAIFVFAVYALGFLIQHPGIVAIVVMGIIAFVGYFVVLSVQESEFYRDFVRRNEERKAANKETVAGREFTATCDQPGYIPPTENEFMESIERIHRSNSPGVTLSPLYRDALYKVPRATRAAITYPPGQTPGYEQSRTCVTTQDDFRRQMDKLIDGFGIGLANFTKSIGQPIASPVRSNNASTIVFYIQRNFREYLLTPQGDLTLTAKVAFAALAAPLKLIGLRDYYHLGIYPTHVRWDTENIVQSPVYFDDIFAETPYRYFADVLLPNEPATEPLFIPEETRFAGTWIVAPPGRGKTNLLHNLIAADLKAGGTVILMDSKGDLINSYRSMTDVVLIEPATAAINPLQLGASTRSLEFLEYIFSALLETAMTPLQKTLFRSVLTLLLKVPNATLETFRQVLTTGWKPFESYVLQCDRSTQDFFMAKPAEFDGSTYKETKQQVLWRLRLILSNEYLRQIFTSPVSNVDFFALLDSGRLVIIDNSKDVLGEEGAEFFGRFFVAVIWMAAVSRSKLRPEQKVPVFCYIDEAHTVIRRDDKIATILDECRSQKIALIMAHQRIAQITSPNVLDALGNCAIRIANSDDDAAALAPRFRTDPQTLRVPVGHFALFVRDTTPIAVTVSVPLFDTSTFPPPLPPPHFNQAPHEKPPPAAPPNDTAYDDRYDLLWSQTLSPRNARDGTVMTIILPNKRTHFQPISAGTKNGHRFRVKGQSGIRRPDGSMGNLWVELEIADMSAATTKEDF